jgi:hypothetical protein
MKVDKIQQALIEILKMDVQFYTSNHYLKEPVLNFTLKIKTIYIEFSFQKFNIDNDIINKIFIVNLSSDRIMNDGIAKFIFNNHYEIFKFKDDNDLINKANIIINYLNEIEDDLFDSICNNNNTNFNREVSDLLYNENLKIVVDSINIDRVNSRESPED